jgi:phosphatidylglycerophosphate synthase
MNDRRRRLITAAALLVGIGLLALTLVNTDFAAARRALEPLAYALPIVLLPSAVWHVLRTEAWRQSFPPGTSIPFARAFRVRLAAEAFSFVTIRGVAGEPLKVLWLAPDVPAMIAAAAVALERVAYLVATSICVGIFSFVALMTMPLTRTWTHVFAWLSLASLAFALLPFLLVRRRRARTDGRTTARRTIIARFLHQLATQFRTLIECDRRRLAILAAIEVAVFGAMALEVWVVLALTETPVTMVGAIAIETFTRAASTASAFIPANLGALEASNAAAAVAMNAAAGAVVLAIARRIRGLFWCAAGFLIYPRTPRRSSSTSASGPTLAVIEDRHPPISIDRVLGGLPLGERICRAAARANYARVLVSSPAQRQSWERIARRVRSRIQVAATDDPECWCAWMESIPSGTPITPLHSGAVPTPGQLTEASATGAPLVTLGEVGIANAEDLASAERKLRDSIFKPTDGPLARFNRRMSIPISVALIRWFRFSAHAMSVFVIALGLYAGWLFSLGTYATGIVAALVSLAASILDGCDGELARLQYKESSIGCWIDTLGDYSYYLAIFAGLTVGAVRQTGRPIFWWLGAALGVGVLLTFALLILLRWRTTDGRPERLRAKTRAHFESTRKAWARTVVWLAGCATRATMPYGILALALFNLLPAVVFLAAIGANIYWISIARELRALLNASKSAAPAVAV